MIRAASGHVSVDWRRLASVAYWSETPADGPRPTLIGHHAARGGSVVRAVIDNNGRNDPNGI
jgi:hypothetical protein